MIDSEALQVTLLVTNLLDEQDIPYVIGGSMASIIHGMLRTTMGPVARRGRPYGVCTRRTNEYMKIICGIGPTFWS